MAYRLIHEGDLSSINVGSATTAKKIRTVSGSKNLPSATSAGAGAMYMDTTNICVWISFGSDGWGRIPVYDIAL
jgi:hypothetical protein